MEKNFTVAEIFGLISQFESFQLNSCKTGRSLTPVTYAEGTSEWDTIQCYLQCNVTGMHIEPKTSDGEYNPFLVIMVETEEQE